jgi:PAS domain S-box-containing protein
MGKSAAASPHDSCLFREMFNASPIGIAVENLDGKPIFVNPAFCRFFGLTEEELRSKHRVDFSPLEDAEKDWALFQKLKAGNIDRYQVEKRYFRKDGSVVSGRLSISLLNGRSSPLVLAMVEDITEQKKAEESRFRQAAIVESSVDAIICQNLDGVITTWNSAAKQLFGYTEGEAVGQPITVLIPSELQHEERDILERIGARKRTEHYETIRVTKAGKRIDVSLSISPIEDSNGRLVGAFKIAHDISDRKKHEEKLREYERAVENAEDIIGVVDREYRLLLANRQYLKMRNMTREQVVGHLVTDVLNKEIFETVIKPKLDECFKGRVVRYERKFSYPGIGERDLLLSYFPIEGANGTIDRVACISRDITERKQAEDALRASEERLRLAMQAGRMYAYDWDVTTDEVLRSPEHAEILGLAEPLHLPHQQFADRIHPDDRPKFLAAITGLTPENPIGEVTYRAPASDGTLVWLKSNGRGLFDAKGRLVRVIGMVADVTNVKRAEETLAEMTRKLIQAQEQERARIGRDLHDDVNQRLAMLAIELEQLKENTSDVGIRVQKLQKQVIDISNDVQALSGDLQSSKLEYLGVAAGMKSWCREFAERRGMHIDYRHEVQSTLPQEIGLCLFRILQEALHNAAKHSGIKRIEVELSEKSNGIHFTIRDLGKGFDVEAVLRGKGLGLTSMRERVRLVNGTIAIDSKPMGGTTIHVRVPLPSKQDSQRAVV